MDSFLLIVEEKKISLKFPKLVPKLFILFSLSREKYSFALFRQQKAFPTERDFHAQSI